jgi:hypothetical protein
MLGSVATRRALPSHSAKFAGKAHLGRVLRMRDVKSIAQLRRWFTKGSGLTDPSTLLYLSRRSRTFLIAVSSFRISG